MHMLDRTSVETPPCLVAPPAERRFPDLTSAEKGEIRSSLLEMQKNRCAYCERRTGISQNEGHIEHFRCQEHHDDLGLIWTNMYWSCVDDHSCGKFKDNCNKHDGPRRRFDPDDLIDPGIDDPDRFFLFVYDGTISMRHNLNERDQKRAKETLRVFNINDVPLLRKWREDAVSPFKESVAFLVQNNLYSMIPTYAQCQLLSVHDKPFATAIKHYLEGLV